MSISTLSYQFLERFVCLCEHCEDSCCQGWAMQVDTQTHDRYATSAPELLVFVTQVGSPDAQQYIMSRDTKTDSCVQCKNGRCATQKDYGELFLSDACALYPRIIRKLGDNSVMTASLSCPEIARQALFHEDAFVEQALPTTRTPFYHTTDYLPDKLSTEDARAIHRIMLDTALDKSMSPEHHMIRILVTIESLARIDIASWLEATPFYLDQASLHLPESQAKPTDQLYLLQALVGLVAAAKGVHHTRLMQTIDAMQKALHVAIDWNTLAITTMPDSAYAEREVIQRWTQEWQDAYAPVLHHYLAMQFSQAYFPFAGFGTSLAERAAIIGIRFATIKLALMCAISLHGSLLPESEIVRIIQSISRFLDHLASPDYSLQIYKETGWLQAPRLRGLLGF